MGCMFSSNFSFQLYVINIQLHNTDNICTDLYIHITETTIRLDLSSNYVMTNMVFNLGRP